MRLLWFALMCALAFAGVLFGYFLSTLALLAVSVCIGVVYRFGVKKMNGMESVFYVIIPSSVFLGFMWIIAILARLNMISVDYSSWRELIFR